MLVPLARAGPAANRGWSEAAIGGGLFATFEPSRGAWPPCGL